MTDTTFDIKNIITSLLTSALPEENLNDYELKIVGTTENGDGFLGDLYFVNLTSQMKNYDFLMKCGKRSEALRKTTPVKDAYEREIFVYNTVFPVFRQFEMARNIVDVFDSVPKCFGTCTCPGKEVIVLQNLRVHGYTLWPKEAPLPRHYLETVLKLYGKWHAISAAMQDQEPEKFAKLTQNIPDVWGDFCRTSACNMLTSSMENIGKILEDDLGKDILDKWEHQKDFIPFYALNLRKTSKSFNVITHGDAWNNNFMFKATGDGEKSKEIKVAMLDWQVSGFSSPVTDISYFLYACISEEDLNDFDDLLMTYYTTFAEHLKNLGSDPEKIYPYAQLLDDWTIYGRLGVLTATIIMSIIGTGKDDVPDLAEIADKGDDVGNIFGTDITNVDLVKKRYKCIIQHAVERNLFKPISNL